MKMKAIKRIAAAALAAAIVCTGVPQAVTVLNPTVTAQAAKKKKKKAAKFSVSPKKLNMTDKDKTYTVKIKGVPKKDFIKKLNVILDDNIDLVDFTNTKAVFKPKKNSSGTITFKYKKQKKTVKYTVNDPTLVTEEEKNFKKLSDYVKANGEKDNYGITYGYKLNDYTHLFIDFFSDDYGDQISLNYSVYDPATGCDTYAYTMVSAEGIAYYASASKTDSNTDKTIYEAVTGEFDAASYKAGDSLSYISTDGKMTPITDTAITWEADKSVAAMYTAFDKFLKENLGFGVKNLGMTAFN